MVKRILLLLALLLAAAPAMAHFGAILPSDDIVTQNDARTLNLQIMFLHPMEGDLMDMARPKRFGVFHDGKTTDLLGTLKEAAGKTAEGKKVAYWTAEYPVRRPGDHVFFVEPVPYWEPAEDKFIVHYTKVCVNALGLEEGWDAPLGLETEIAPLTRPYGLWTGNLFSGQVLLKGKPVPFAEVEVEYLNASPDNPAPVRPPADPYVTQVVRADANGIFHYAMPRAGWWGFAALSDADWTLDRDGEQKSVEIGAVYWVRAIDMK